MAAILKSSHTPLSPSSFSCTTSRLPPSSCGVSSGVLRSSLLVPKGRLSRFSSSLRSLPYKVLYRRSLGRVLSRHPSPMSASSERRRRRRTEKDSAVGKINTQGRNNEWRLTDTTRRCARTGSSSSGSSSSSSSSKSSSCGSNKRGGKEQRAISSTPSLLSPAPRLSTCTFSVSSLPGESTPSPSLSPSSIPPSLRPTTTSVPAGAVLLPFSPSSKQQSLPIDVQHGQPPQQQQQQQSVLVPQLQQTSLSSLQPPPHQFSPSPTTPRLCEQPMGSLQRLEPPCSLFRSLPSSSAEPLLYLSNLSSVSSNASEAEEDHLLLLPTTAASVAAGGGGGTEEAVQREDWWCSVAEPGEEEDTLSGLMGGKGFERGEGGACLPGSGPPTANHNTTTMRTSLNSSSNSSTNSDSSSRNGTTTVTSTTKKAATATSLSSITTPGGSNNSANSIPTTIAAAATATATNTTSFPPLVPSLGNVASAAISDMTVPAAATHFAARLSPPPLAAVTPPPPPRPPRGRAATAAVAERLRNERELFKEVARRLRMDGRLLEGYEDVANEGCSFDLNSLTCEPKRVSTPDPAIPKTTAAVIPSSAESVESTKATISPSLSTISVSSSQDSNSNRCSSSSNACEGGESPASTATSRRRPLSLSSNSFSPAEQRTATTRKNLPRSQRQQQHQQQQRKQLKQQKQQQEEPSRLFAMDQLGKVAAARVPISNWKELTNLSEGLLDSWSTGSLSKFEVLGRLLVGRWETLLPRSDPLEPLFKQFGIAYLKRAIVDRLAIPLTITLQGAGEQVLHVVVHLPVGNRQMQWMLDGSTSTDDDPDCGTWEGAIRCIGLSLPWVCGGRSFPCLQQVRAHKKIGVVYETRAILPDEQHGRILFLNYNLYPKRHPGNNIDVVRILKPVVT